MNRPISVQEAATILGISEVAVLKRIGQGSLVAKKLSGKAYLISRESVQGRRVDAEAFLASCRKWVSVPEACEIVCVTDGMIARMLADGRLNGFRLNERAWAVSRESCERNIAEYLANPNTGGRPRLIGASRAPKKRARKTA